MTDKPRIPNIEERVRLLGTLLRIDTPKPIQPPDEYVFEDVDARVEIRMGDRVLKECGTFCDWYGCAVTSGIKEALGLREHGAHADQRRRGGCDQGHIADQEAPVERQGPLHLRQGVPAVR